MDGCECAGKPPIAILMAVYEPRMDWLREQLESLEAQTYPELKLYVRDDCSPTVPYGEIEHCVAECIRSFPYEIRRNDRNLGSTGTFELLTREAEGAYFAYCDQDDVWLPEKLALLQETLEEGGALLVCSDMYVIDGDGKRIADSITDLYKQYEFRSGDGLVPGLLVSPFVTGCTMLIRGETARTALPFCPYMFHDYYLSLRAASEGRIVSSPRKLILRRIHGANLSAAMPVTGKADYFAVYIEPLVKRLVWLGEAFRDDPELSARISEMLLWAEAREGLFRGGGGTRRTVLRYRRYNLLASVFEVLMAGAPEPLFAWVIGLSRKRCFTEALQFLQKASARRNY